MNSDQLIAELAKYLDKQLAKEFVSEFVAIRNDCKTGILGRTSIGKFVETVVQLFQTLETGGKYDKKPNVDLYLKNLESKLTPLNDDLKIVCNRIARASYSLRNKRNIAHKGEVDSNIYDLKYIYASAQWILSEIVRQFIKTDMASAGAMIEFIQIPVSSVVEDLGDRKLVFGKFTVEQELLVLLHSYYPNYISVQSIRSSLDRRSTSSISNALSKLWKDKLIHRKNLGYKLTQEGFNKVLRILQNSNLTR